MIECKDGLFHLKNDNLSYLFRVTRYGLLEQLHFGAPIETADAQALACQPGPGWGCCLQLNDADSASCYDALPLCWSGSGRSDLRESPLEMDGGPTDFCYVNHRVLPTPPPMASGLPQTHDGQQTLEITLEQPNSRIYLYFTLFDTAITRRTVLENRGSTPISLHKLMSFCLDLPGSYEMTTFNGGWISELTRRCTLPVGMSRIVNESVTGFSSHRHNPGFLLSEPGTNETSGRVYGFNLLYSGNHYASAQQSLQGLTRVMQGISPNNFCEDLLPGQQFETPEAVLCYAQAGFSDLSNRMHRFVTDHVIPPYWRLRERPVLYNSWEGCMFDFHHNRLLSLAKQAKNLGCELFVLDDGWFGKRNDDHAGLGDYTVNPKKLPAGLEGLRSQIQKLGMAFGLWFEPECVNEDSDLYRAHPDWALTDAYPTVTGRHQLLLDLTKPEVRDYIVEHVTHILDSTHISYVKWDMNRHSTAQGARSHRYILGLYDVLRRIFQPRPEILLESCASGGNRFDLGMLCFGPQIWCSDNTDPISRLDIQQNLSYLYPQSTFGAHVSAAPHAQTLRATPLTTRGNVSFFGCLGYELDLKHLLPVEQEEIKGQILFYKQYRRLFQFGRFYRLPNGWQVTLEGTTAVGVFHKILPPAPGYEQLRLQNLEPSKRYHLRTRAQKIRIGQFAQLLKHVTPVKLNPNGSVVHTVDRFYSLQDGTEGYHVSGAALNSGIMLLPLFRGTGYDEAQRTQGDYASNLYLIEEETP